MTKEPKLERARRLLPEWTRFDETGRQLYDDWKAGRLGPEPKEQEPELIKDEL